MNNQENNINSNLLFKFIDDNIYNPYFLNIINQKLINPLSNKIKPYIYFYIFSQCLIILLLFYIIYKKS